MVGVKAKTVSRETCVVLANGNGHSWLARCRNTRMLMGVLEVDEYICDAYI